MRAILSVGDKILRILLPAWWVKFCRTLTEPHWGLTRLLNALLFSLFVTDNTFSRVRLFIGSTSYEVACVNMMWKNRTQNTRSTSGFFIIALNISLKMWAPKYQCGVAKIVYLEANVAPGFLKLFSTPLMTWLFIQFAQMPIWVHYMLRILTAK